MNSLIKTSIKRPVTICILVIILLAVGVLATMDMSTNLLPGIAMPMMGITMIYPGAGAQSVEDNVTAVLENALQTIPGITELETMSYDNVSIAILTFDYGTDLDKKIDAIEDNLKTVSFPDGCQDPAFIKIDMNGTATATITVFNETYSNPDKSLDVLKENAETLATKLRSIEGVGSVEIFGMPTDRIKITSLEGLDITSLLIVQALSNENLDIPLGTINQNGSSVSIRNESNAKSILEVMKIPATLELSSTVLSSIASVKNGVKLYATCTMDEFLDYVQKANDAKKVIEEIEGKTADELEEQQNSLAAVKSLMSLVKNNTSNQLEWMKKDLLIYLDRHQEDIGSWTDEDYEHYAEQFENQYNLAISADTLKWVCESYLDGTLEEKFDKMIAFREIFPYVDTNEDGVLNGDDITYEQFATLFQDGGSVEVETTDEEGEVFVEEKSYDGLDLLHTAETHEGCDDDCERETFTHDEATDVCKFADSVNTVAYDSIIDSVREAEEKGEEAEDPVISDQQFAALFVNSTQGNDFSALMSPQVIHIIRQPNFNQKVDGKDSIVDILTNEKQRHVNENGNAVYINGQEIFRNDDDKIVVMIDGKEYTVNNFGRLENEDGDLVDKFGNVLRLTEEQEKENFYSYGDWIIFSDVELLKLYEDLNTDTDFGITPTNDTVRLIRICDFVENVNKLVVPIAYVGHVEEEKFSESYAQYNGIAAATIKVFATTDANTTKVVDNVKKVLGAFESESKALLLDDKAQFISDSISNVLSSIIIGGVLAVLVIYLFVRKIGSSLVIAITMPLSVLVALLGLWAMKITLNMVSLGGLAVGIGMLVDNSIVVLESITKHRDAGENVFDSCWKGTREVAGSLLASTLTNICVFFPILFSRGLTREVFYDMVWAVMFSIVMSLLVAVTVIPSLYHLVYKNSSRPRYKTVNGEKVLVGTFEEREPRESTPVKKEKKQKTKTAKVGNPSQALHKMEKGYGKVLTKVLTKRIVVCVVALVLFGVSVGLVFTTGFDFMPSVDKGLIEINMTFDGSATLDECRTAGKEAAKLISEKYGTDVEYVALTVGKQGILATDTTNVLRVQLDTSKLKTTQTSKEIRALLQQSDIKVKTLAVTEVDGVVAEVTGGMSGQSVTLLCDDMNLLAEVADKVAKKLEGVEGLVSVIDKTAKKTEQISFNFDKTECAKRGVNYQNAVLMLRVGMSGYTAANVKIDGESLDVNVEFAEVTKSDIDSLVNIVVGFDDDGAVKLGDVLKKTADGALYETDYVVSSIGKQDGKFVTSIDVEGVDADTGTISRRIAAAVNEVLAEYPQVSYEEGGVASYLTDAFNGLVISLIAAFLLLYGVMACQFESLLKPFVVIMSIPFSFTGGFLALVLTGTSLSVVSFVGIIMLMGVIVNGAIVMIDKINLLIEEGMAPQQAVINGCTSRLRPILMTTLTTVLALIPLALGLGRGGELMQPMGIVVIGGLLLGTTVTLVLIPCFYCIVKRISFKNWTPAESSNTAEAVQEVAVENDETAGDSPVSATEAVENVESETVSDKKKE